MHDVKISVTPHRSLNSSQGVISEPDLMKESDSDILDGMRDQGVTAVRRIMIRRDGNEIPTKHVILTFDRCTLPQSVTAGFLHCEVRPYIPNPRRCFKCQRYGHSTNSCRGRLTCAKCAEHDHPTENCKTDHLKCANCQQPHAAYSRTCDKFKAEKQIINLKVTQNITYQEARRKHAMFSPRYADAARRGAGPRMVSVATQCSSADLVPPLPPDSCPRQPKTSPHCLCLWQQWRQTLLEGPLSLRCLLHPPRMSLRGWVTWILENWLRLPCPLCRGLLQQKSAWLAKAPPTL